MCSALRLAPGALRALPCELSRAAVCVSLELLIGSPARRPFIRPQRTFAWSNRPVPHVTRRRILLFPNGNNVQQLSVYLDVADSVTLPQGWSRQAHFSLTVQNQKDPSKSVVKGARLHATPIAPAAHREHVPRASRRAKPAAACRMSHIAEWPCLPKPPTSSPPDHWWPLARCTASRAVLHRTLVLVLARVPTRLARGARRR